MINSGEHATTQMPAENEIEMVDSNPEGNERSEVTQNQQQEEPTVRKQRLSSSICSSISSDSDGSNG
jgi:hypothetical protein